MIKKKTMYEASDGTLLPSRDAAQTYNDMLDLYAYVDKNPIVAYAGQHASDEVGGAALQKWLRDNPRVFIKLLPEDTVNGD